MITHWIREEEPHAVYTMTIEPIGERGDFKGDCIQISKIEASICDAESLWRSPKWRVATYREHLWEASHVARMYGAPEVKTPCAVAEFERVEEEWTRGRFDHRVRVIRKLSGVEHDPRKSLDVYRLETKPSTAEGPWTMVAESMTKHRMNPFEERDHERFVEECVRLGSESMLIETGA